MNTTTAKKSEAAGTPLYQAPKTLTLRELIGRLEAASALHGNPATNVSAVWSGSKTVFIETDPGGE